MTRAQSVALAIGAGVFLSLLGVGTRLLEDTSAFKLVYYRSIGLVLFLTPIILYTNKNSLGATIKAIGFNEALASICLVGTSIFVVLALMNTAVANAMFVISLAPLVAGIFAWIALREQLRFSTIIAIVISIVGVLIIVNDSLSTNGLLGILYAFAMLFCYGLFSVTLRRGRGQDMLPCVVIHGFILILALPIFIQDLSISQYDLILCLSLGVFQLGLGMLMFTAASKGIPAAQLVLLAMLEVVLSPVWVWLIVGEAPSQSSLIGGGIIITAICFQAITTMRDDRIQQPQTS